MTVFLLLSVRATLAACTKEMQVLLAKNPVPPILNNALLEWVSLYLGRKEYAGITQLSEQWVEADEFDGIEGDVNLYKIREMTPDRVLQQLLDAYDKDYPQGDDSSPEA